MFNLFSIRALMLTATVASTLALAAACGGGDDSSSADTPAPTSASGSSSTPANGSSNGEVKEAEVELKDNVFAPTTLTLPVGATVEIEVKNTGQAIHNMHILSLEQEGKDFSSDAMVNPGDDSKFQVKFTKKGTYKFQCDYHVPDMVGTITVN